MFLTNKAAQEKISTLESRVSELESDAAARDEHVTGLEATITDRDATIVENSTRISGLEIEAAKVPVLTADLEASRKETAEAKASAGKQATEQLASIGQPKSLEVINPNPAANNEVTREAFNAMTARQKSEFSIAGGKIKS